ncbi:XRE family transcriptional regulator [Eubacterium sp. am_0171]|uniref:Predicted transcriptional regulator n=1 Tax=Faecalicatena contorta TaxID=39482 RepID=A0A174BT49_9FIRM|nr:MULTISPECIES: helix-turn-helix transcriptional regulator [Clostridia]MSC83203.1 helix-turn-helix domain-containing protein [Eubacterium sp. BIOML-A1]MSD05691.1 helix-turn-helix domain-containing protein [Eubacterium sp. BIOML-A2]RYT24584.1 XRE family transcriptional regulator [Eubacterium sp. am_0171]CUO03954.1 Predicted transcriptional regulator [[Eubacterium] contortum] [Faecalicatena contorta]
MALNDNIRKLREENNLTQQQLADRLYVSRQTVCRWENGSRCPDLVTAKKLAIAFDVSLDELISDEDIESSKDDLGFWKSERLKDRKRLHGYQKLILKCIQIVGAIYIVISVFCRIQLDIRVPVWCTLTGLCIAGAAFVINYLLSRKLDHL